MHTERIIAIVIGLLFNLMPTTGSAGQWSEKPQCDKQYEEDRAVCQKVIDDERTALGFSMHPRLFSGCIAAARALLGR